MNFNRLLISLIAIILFASSCNNKPSDLTHIPDNTIFVLTINPQQLKDKSGVDNFANTNMYNHIISSDSSEIDKEMLSQIHEYDYIFKDGTQSGVDFKKQMFIYAMSNKNGGQTFKAVNFGINNKDKFEVLLKKATKKHSDSIIFANQDDISYLMSTKKNNKGIIAWTSNSALIFGIDKGYCSQDLLIEKSVKLLKLSLSNSIAQNKSFVDFYKKRKDISVWMSSDFLINQIPKGHKAIVGMQLPINPKGIEYRYYINFKKGQAEIETELILSDDLKNFMDEYKIIKSKFNKDILSYVPSNSIFNFSIAINAHEFYRMVKDLYKERQMNIDGMESLAEASLNTDFEKIFKAINGEFIINIHDVSIKEEPESELLNSNGCSEKEFISMKMSMLVKLDNDELYKLFLRQFNKNESKMIDGYYTIFENNQKLYATMNANIMMITNDKSVIKAFVAQTPLSPSLKDGEVGKALDNYALYGKANLDYSSYGADVQKYYDNKYSDIDQSNLRHKIKEIRLVPNNSYSNKIVIELKDKNRNSMEVLFNDKTK